MKRLNRPAVFLLIASLSCLLSCNDRKPVRGIIIQPENGQVITEVSHVTVKVKAVNAAGETAEVRQVKDVFVQFRPILSDDWTDIPKTPKKPGGGEFEKGLIRFWDAENLSGGKYAMRAVLTNTSGESDPAPPEIEIWLATPNKGQTLVVGIILTNDQATLQFKHVLPYKYDGLEEPVGEMKISAYLESGHQIFAKRIRDPRMVFYDDIDPATGQITGGGMEIQERSAFAVTLPYNYRISYLTLSGQFGEATTEVGPIYLDR